MIFHGSENSRKKPGFAPWGSDLPQICTISQCDDCFPALNSTLLVRLLEMEQVKGWIPGLSLLWAERCSVPPAYLYPRQGLWIPSLQRGTRQHFRAPLCNAHSQEKLALNVKRQITAVKKQQPRKNLHGYQNYVIEDAICHLLYNRAYILKHAGNSIPLTSSRSYSTSVLKVSSKVTLFMNFSN